MRLFASSIPLLITSVDCSPPNYPGFFDSLNFPINNFENEVNSIFSQPLTDINNFFNDDIGANNGFIKQITGSFDNNMKKMQQNFVSIGKLAKGSPNFDSFSQSISSELVTDPETGKQEVKTHKEVHENGPHTHNSPINEKKDTLTDANTGEIISSESDDIPPESN